MSHIYIFSPSSAVRDKAAFKRGIKRLQAQGHQVEVDADALSSSMRFAGSDETRLNAIARACASGADIAMISRGGYGLTRILPRIHYKKVAKAIEAANMKTVKWPSDGKFLGDWKEGEKIAQSGRGLTWTDKAEDANGGNCYNCHQISKEEISFGTLGPSLYNYGKLRGVTDPNSPAAKAMVEYTWGKLYNSRAYNACSQMPRAGHKGILNEQQLKHVMALLLDPASPVNK